MEINKETGESEETSNTKQPEKGLRQHHQNSANDPF